MTDRTVSAQAVIDAVVDGDPVYEHTEAHRILKRLRLLDLLPPWYEVEVWDEDGWTVVDDECPTLAIAERAVKENEREDKTPVRPHIGGPYWNEPPKQYLERVAKWAEECAAPSTPEPRKYRIREYRYGKRPRTVTTEKRG